MAPVHNSEEARSIPCKDFDDFTANVRAPHWGVPLIYRGQRNTKWSLQSLWERRLQDYRDSFGAPHGEQTRDLDTLFGGREGRHQFREAFRKVFLDSVVGLPGVNSEALRKDPQEVWALGRHHGLVTPLLDWTRSPYIAAFFACMDYTEYHNPGFKSGLRGAGGGINFVGSRCRPATPIAVWELALGSGMEVKGEFTFITSRIDQAFRQKAQRGIFTQLDSSTHIDLESYLASRDLAHYLTRYELPGEEVGRALQNLLLMGINYGSLFPDLEGAALEANTDSALQALKFQYPLQKDLMEKEDAGLGESPSGAFY